MPALAEGEMTVAPKAPNPREREKRQTKLTAAAFEKHGRASVKLNVGLAGQRFAHLPGAVIEVPGDEAKRLIENGIAVPVKDTKRTATTKPSETRG